MILELHAMLIKITHLKFLMDRNSKNSYRSWYIILSINWSVKCNDTSLLCISTILFRYLENISLFVLEWYEMKEEKYIYTGSCKSNASSSNNSSLVWVEWIAYLYHHDAITEVKIDPMTFTWFWIWKVWRNTEILY